MGDITMTSANSTFAYSYQGKTNIAKLRCSNVGIAYSQNADESHAREHRAYYPHRRSQGSFNVVVDCKQWVEFNSTMAWFRDYATAALDLDAGPTSPPMSVQVPSRNFNRLGIPTQGVQYGDYVGSMVFSPQISFLSVSDPNDATTGILNSNQVSATFEPTSDPANNYFYPDSIASYPGKLAQYLYDQNLAIQIAAQDLADLVAAQNNALNHKIAGLG